MTQGELDIRPAKPAKRPKGRPREFDRDQALAAALDVFWEKGFEPATLPDLCKAMGINPPSLYSAFGNKAQLFLEALNYYEKTYWAEPIARFFAEPDIYIAVYNFFRAAAAIMLAPDRPAGSMAALSTVNISDSEKEIIQTIDAMRAKNRKIFVDRLSVGIRDGQIPPDANVQALAGGLYAFLEGLSLQSRDVHFQYELLAIADLAVRLLPPPRIKESNRH